MNFKQKQKKKKKKELDQISVHCQGNYLKISASYTVHVSW